MVVLALTVKRCNIYFDADEIMSLKNLHLYTAGMLYPPVLFADIVALGPVQLYARPCTRQMILRMYTHRPAKRAHRVTRPLCIPIMINPGWVIVVQSFRTRTSLSRPMQLPETTQP